MPGSKAALLALAAAGAVALTACGGGGDEELSTISLSMYETDESEGVSVSIPDVSETEGDGPALSGEAPEEPGTADPDAVSTDGTITVENTGDTDVIASVIALSVNGIMIDDLDGMNVTVSPGESGSFDINVPDETLSALGISEVKSMYAYVARSTVENDSSQRLTKYVVVDTGEETSPARSGETLYDDDGLYVSYRGIEDGKLLVYIENNTGYDLDFTTCKFRINGEPSDNLFSETIFSGCGKNCEIELTGYMTGYSDTSDMFSVTVCFEGDECGTGDLIAETTTLKIKL